MFSNHQCINVQKEKEHITEMNYKKGILCQDSNSITVLIKMRFASY